MSLAQLDDGLPQEEFGHFARELEAAYGNLDGSDLLRPLITRVFPGRIALVSSFGAESAVLLHMVARIDRRTPVIFLDTGKLFGETLAYRETLVQRLGLTDVRDVRPDPAEIARVDPSGTLWNTDGNACCWVRKVLPLQRALTGFSAWITGRKRFQAGGREHLGAVETDGERIKINPLVTWSHDQVLAYLADNGLPRHPLVDQGYPSIGCAPCTAPAAANAPTRSGRWQGSGKNECGIHITPGGRIKRIQAHD